MIPGKGSNWIDFKLKEAEKEIKEDSIEQLNALIRYHYKIEPENLSDKDFFKMAAGLQWVIEQENKAKNKGDG